MENIKPVCIVILSLNTLRYTKECVESILKHTDPNLYEFFFIDRGSIDGSKEYLQALGHKLVITDSNTGYATGCNMGITESKNPYVCLFNSDVIVKEDKWLNNMIGVFETHPKMAIVAPQVYIAQTNKLTKEHTGGVKFAPGVVWLLRRKQINEIGLLDTQFGYGLMEDVDYCDRCKELGLSIYVCSNAKVYHYEHRTFIANNINMTEMNKTNRLKYAEKKRLKREGKIPLGK